MGIAVTLLLFPSLAVAQPSNAEPSPPPSSAHERGLLLELRYETSEETYVRDTFGNVFYMPEPRGTIFAGYQLHRWSFGVGLQLARRADRGNDENTDDDYAQTTFMLVPGARVALGRSSDGRAELIAAVDVGFGEARRTFENGFAEDTVAERVQLQLGPGLRYWLGPSFAFGASTLIRHTRYRVETEDPFNGASSGTETASTYLATSLNVTGVF